MLGFTGGFKKQWISSIARSEPVNNVVMQEANQLKQTLEMKMAFRQRLPVGQAHFGSATKKGLWGMTRVLWPMSDSAIEYSTTVLTAAEAQGLKRKGTGGPGNG